MSFFNLVKSNRPVCAHLSSSSTLSLLLSVFTCRRGHNTKRNKYYFFSTYSPFCNMTLRLLGWYIYLNTSCKMAELQTSCKRTNTNSCTQILTSASSHTTIAYLWRNAVSRVGGLMLHGSSHQPASETSTHFICCLLPLPVHRILRHVICLT